MLLLARPRQGHGCRAAGAFTWLLYPAPGGFGRRTLPRLVSCVPSHGACVRGRDLLLGPRSSTGKLCSQHKGEKQPQPLALLLLCSWVGIPALQLAWLWLGCGSGTLELQSTLLCTVWSRWATRMQLIALPNLQSHKLVMNSVSPLYPADVESHSWERGVISIPTQLRG